MNKLISLKKRLSACGVGVVVVMALSSFVLSPVFAGDNAKTDKDSDKAADSAKLSGADLYAINCNRCHAERYPKEFQSSQWTTLLTHMRVRANIPASQAREILKYLQSESGN